MIFAKLQQYCATLPQVTSDVKWGRALVRRSYELVASKLSRKRNNELQELLR